MKNLIVEHMYFEFLFVPNLINASSRLLGRQYRVVPGLFGTSVRHYIPLCMSQFDCFCYEKSY